MGFGFGSDFKFSDCYFRYVNLGKSQMSEPQFPRLESGDYNNQPSPQGYWEDYIK